MAAFWFLECENETGTETEPNSTGGSTVEAGGLKGEIGYGLWEASERLS